MKTWLILLGGLLVWTVHFFGLYALAEIAPKPSLVIALTIICLAANIALFLFVRNLPLYDQFGAWRGSVAQGGAMISLVAVIWQALPAIAA